MTEEEASGSTEGEPTPFTAPAESEEAAYQAPASPAVPSAPAPAVPPAPAPSAPETASVEERKAALAQAVAGQIAQGYRVESQSDFQAVVVKGKRPSHLLHLILTIITLGLWGIVWIVLSITMHVHRRIVLVNELGSTTVQHVKNQRDQQEPEEALIGAGARTGALSADRDGGRPRPSRRRLAEPRSGLGWVQGRGAGVGP